MSFVYEFRADWQASNSGFTVGSNMKANDRRKLINHSFGSWFEDQQMKLGRDWHLEYVPEPYPYKFKAPNNIRLTIYDKKKAVLFKLIHGGSV